MASFFQPKAYGPELLALAKQIGVNPRDGRLMLLVEDMAKPESMPARWTSKFDLKKKRWVYTYLPTNEISHQHPSIDYYRGALFMDMGGYRVLLRNLEARPPTDEEIARMNEYFAIGLDEDPYIQEVGQLACVAPLPEGFEEIPDDTGTGATYKDKETNIMLDEHPLDAYFRELRDRRRRELARRRLATIKAMQALRMMQRSNSKDASRSEGKEDGEGVEEETEEEAEQQKEDPRLTALMVEWQLLQNSTGKAAEALATVHNLSSNLPTTPSGITAAAAVAAAAAAATTAAAGGSSMFRWPSGRGSPRSSFNSVGSVGRRPLTPNQSRLSSNNVLGNAAATGTGGQSTALPPLGAQQGRPAGSILDTIIQPSPPGSAAGERRPSRMQTMTKAALTVPAIFETLPQSGSGADGTGGGSAANGILFPPTAFGGPLLDGERLGQLTRLTTDAATAATSVTNLLAPPKQTRVGSTMAAAAGGSGVAGAASGPSAPPGTAPSTSKDAQAMQQQNGGDGVLLSPLFEPAVSDDDDAAFALATQTIRTIRQTMDNVCQYVSLLPSEAGQALASMPRVWLAIMRLVPSNWAERMRLTSWPQLLTWLPADWVERVQQHMKLPSLPEEGRQGQEQSQGQENSETNERIEIPAAGAAATADANTALQMLPPALLRNLPKLPPGVLHGLDVFLALALERNSNGSKSSSSPIPGSASDGGVGFITTVKDDDSGAGIKGSTKSENTSSFSTGSEGAPGARFRSMAADRTQESDSNKQRRQQGQHEHHGDEEHRRNVERLQHFLDSCAAPSVMATLMDLPSGVLEKLMGLPAPTLEQLAALPLDVVQGVSAPSLDANTLGTILHSLSEISPHIIQGVLGLPSAALETFLALEPEGIHAFGSPDLDPEALSRLIAGQHPQLLNRLADMPTPALEKLVTLDPTGLHTFTSPDLKIKNLNKLLSRYPATTLKMLSGLSDNAVHRLGDMPPSAVEKLAALDRSGQHSFASPDWNPDSLSKLLTRFTASALDVMFGLSTSVILQLRDVPSSAVEKLAALDESGLEGLMSPDLNIDSLNQLLSRFPATTLLLLSRLSDTAIFRLSELAWGADSHDNGAPVLSALLAALDPTAVRNLAAALGGPPAAAPAAATAAATAAGDTSQPPPSTMKGGRSMGTTSTSPSSTVAVGEARNPRQHGTPDPTGARVRKSGDGGDRGMRHITVSSGGSGSRTRSTSPDLASYAAAAAAAAAEAGGGAGRMGSWDKAVPSTADKALGRKSITGTNSSKSSLSSQGSGGGAAAARSPAAGSAGGGRAIAASSGKNSSASALIASSRSGKHSGAAIAERLAIAADKAAAERAAAVAEGLAAAADDSTAGGSRRDARSRHILPGRQQLATKTLPDAISHVQYLRTLDPAAAAAATALVSLPGNSIAAVLAAPLPLLQRVAGLDHNILQRLAAIPEDLLVLLLKIHPDELWRMVELSRDAMSLTPSWLDDFRDFLEHRTKVLKSTNRGTQTPTLPPTPSMAAAVAAAEAAAAAAEAAATAASQTAARMLPQHGGPGPGHQGLQGHVHGGQQQQTQLMHQQLPPWHQQQNHQQAYMLQLQQQQPQQQQQQQSPAAAAADAAWAAAAAAALALSPPGQGRSASAGRKGPQDRWAQPRPQGAQPASASILMEPVGGTYQESRNNRRDFDSRPVNLEFKRRNDLMRDRDLKITPTNPYMDTADELHYKSYRDSDIKHLKQRIVRVEMQRSQMGAKLLHYSRIYHNQLKNMSAALATAQREAYELRLELELAKEEQGSILSRLELAASAHAELALIAAMPQVPTELKERLALLYNTVNSSVTQPAGSGASLSSRKPGGPAAANPEANGPTPRPRNGAALSPLGGGGGPGTTSSYLLPYARAPVGNNNNLSALTQQMHPECSPPGDFNRDSFGGGFEQYGSYTGDGAWGMDGITGMPLLN